MSNKLDLASLSIQKINALLQNGISAQLLLVFMTKMSTDEYSSRTRKFESSTKLIGKQDAYAKYLILKGASLKDVPDFTDAFFKNHLQLFIENGYNLNDLLYHVSCHYEGSDRVKMAVTLIRKKVDIKFLNLVQLPIKEVKELLKHGVAAQELLVSLTSTVITQDSSGGEKSDTNLELIARQSELAKFLINNGASLKDISDFSTDFLKNNLQLLTENGKNLSGYLWNISSKYYGSDRLEILLELIKHKADIKFLNVTQLTIEEVEELLKHGVPAQEMLASLVAQDATKYSSVTGKFETSPELIANQSDLAKFLIEQGADLKDVTTFSGDFVKNHPSLVQEHKESRYFALANFTPNDMEINPVVLKLIKSIFVNKDYSKEYVEQAFIELCYKFHKIIDASPTIAKVLAYVSESPNLDIYVDDDKVVKKAVGTYYSDNGNISVSQNTETSTHIHESFHKAFDSFYKNSSRPYSQGDLETMSRLNDLIESELLMQDIVAGYYSWFPYEEAH